MLHNDCSNFATKNLLSVSFNWKSDSITNERLFFSFANRINGIDPILNKIRLDESERLMKNLEIEHPFG
jgi:hypothetical protein